MAGSESERAEPVAQPVVEDETVDWLGNPVSCRDCAHEENRRAGMCDLGRTCVNDRRGKRIDRFFAANPLQADRYLGHPYFEVRTLAVKYASLFRLTPLIDDPEPDVRARAALRLPKPRARGCAGAPDRGVRMTVARRLDGEDLVPLLADPDYGVRLAATRKAPPALLVRVMHDEDAEIRREAARRIDEHLLTALAGDEDPTVRLIVAERMRPEHLKLLAADEDLRVRFTVVERAPVAELSRFLDDPEDVVREVARQRLEPQGEL